MVIQIMILIIGHIDDLGQDQITKKIIDLHQDEIKIIWRLPHFNA